MKKFKAQNIIPSRESVLCASVCKLFYILLCTGSVVTLLCDVVQLVVISVVFRFMLGHNKFTKLHQASFFSQDAWIYGRVLISNYILIINNYRILRRSSSFFTLSSLRRKLSSTCILKQPRRNRVQITCNTLSVYHMQRVCHLV